MKVIASFVGILFLFTIVKADNSKCDFNMKSVVTQDWITLQSGCVRSMREQIQKEITASTIYMAMGSYFSRDTVNRPGFAKFFFESAKEERDHAMKLIQYLLMRGELIEDVTQLIHIPQIEKHEWSNGLEALRDALDLEVKVTNSIKDLIVTCETDKVNDYHLVDYLTGEFLEEQYHGQRELAGKISTLDKMKTGAIGEFLFDKTLLE